LNPAILGSEKLASAKYAAIEKLAKAEKRILTGPCYKRSNQNQTVFDQSFEESNGFGAPY
jgi:hypothetical protein